MNEKLIQLQEYLNKGPYKGKIFLGDIQKTKDSIKIKLKDGQTLTISTSILAYGTSVYPVELSSSVFGTHTHITYNGTAADMKLFNVRMLDLDATTSIREILCWYGSVTNCTNIRAFREIDFQNSVIGGIAI
mgnify:CR=1 FL=1